MSTAYNSQSAESKQLVIVIDYVQGSADWDKRPTKVTIDGEESNMLTAIDKVLHFQPAKEG